MAYICLATGVHLWLSTKYIVRYGLIYLLGPQGTQWLKVQYKSRGAPLKTLRGAEDNRVIKQGEDKRVIKQGEDKRVIKQGPSLPGET